MAIGLAMDWEREESGDKAITGIWPAVVSRHCQFCFPFHWRLTSHHRQLSPQPRSSLPTRTPMEPKTSGTQ